MTSKAFGLAQLGNVYDDGALSSRNLIINGAMQVAQRGTSVTAQTANGYYTCDRWYLEAGGPTYDVEQVSEAPYGFQYSQKVTLDGAYTPTASQFMIPFEYRIEGNDLQRLAYGTSAAKELVLSFWIRSSKTGTYVVDFTNNRSGIRTQAQSYTVNASDTWEYKTLTYTGDTSAAFDAGVGTSLSIFWWMVAGTTFTSGTLATSWENQTNANRAVGVPSSAADNDYWQITGVQLEAGDTATPFEHEPYSVTLQKCQRYYQKIGPLSSRRMSYAHNTTDIMTSVELPTVMRATPSFANGSSTNNAWDVNTAGYRTISNVTANSITQTSLTFEANVTGATAGEVYALYGLGCELDAEL